MSSLPQDPIAHAHHLNNAAAPDLDLDNLPIPNPLPPIECNVYYLSNPMPADQWIGDAVKRGAAQVYIEIGHSGLQELQLYATSQLPTITKYLTAVHPLVFGPLAGQ